MDPQRPSFMITGTGVPGKRAAQVAYGGFWMSVGSDAIRIPRGGIGPLNHSFPKVADDIRRRIDRAGCPGLVGGHSQGGFDAVKFGLLYPEYVHSIMTFSTPYGGLAYSIGEMRRGLKRTIGSVARPLTGFVNPIWNGLEPAVMRALKASVPSLYSLAYMDRELLELKQMVEQDWSPKVRLAMVGSLDDKLVRVDPEDPAGSTAFALSLPDGEPDRYCLYTTETHPVSDDVHFIKATRGGHLSMVAEKSVYRLVMRYSYPPEVEPESPAGTLPASVGDIAAAV